MKEIEETSLEAGKRLVVKYTHLLLDLDGTLLDFEAAQKQAFFRAMAQIGVPADEGMLHCYDQINESYWRLLERGEVTKDALLVARFSDFFKRYLIECDPADFNHLYISKLAQGIDLIEGALHTLEALSGRFVLAAVTNGVGSSQRSRLALSGLDRYFDAIFISEELGCEKPDARFFQAVCAHYAPVNPNRMLIIGDSLTADIQGAINSQIDSCWVHTKGPISETVCPTYRIASIRDLVPLLQSQGDDCMIKQRALDYFKNQNHNCSESIFRGACPEISSETLKAIGCFGGGMGCGKTCGALAGGIAAIGLRHVADLAHNSPDSRVLSRTFATAFELRFGGVDCSVLKPKYFVEGERCSALVGECAELLEELL